MSKASWLLHGPFLALGLILCLFLLLLKPPISVIAYMISISHIISVSNISLHIIHYPMSASCKSLEPEINYLPHYLIQVGIFR